MEADQLEEREHMEAKHLDNLFFYLKIFKIYLCIYLGRTARHVGS